MKPDKKKSVREILEDYHKAPISVMTSQGTTYSIDQALSDLAELVLAERNMPELMLSEYGKGWNDALDFIAKKIRDNGSGQRGRE